jgi:N-acetyl-gamma-glutamyl-phosphate reductase
MKVGVVGGTGYTGVELLRLLVSHPQAEITLVTSRTEAGRPVADCFPNLRGHLDAHFCDPGPRELSGCDLVFFATPNGTAMKMVPALLKAGVRVIDLAADFRLKDPRVWQHWYKMEHACPELLEEAVYGLPELNREAIRPARLIANPGCYPTATLLGFLPALQGGWIESDTLIADAKSGVSGAGRKLETQMLYSEAADNFNAYAVPGHRHWPEMMQILQSTGEAPLDLTFVPHLTPTIRGIHATLYARLSGDVDIQAEYERYYQNEPFVDVMPAGTHPETRSVRAANDCRIAVHRAPNSRTLIVLSVIDNLVKGAAGQAVQNMNLMFGFDETLGLRAPAVLP